MTAERATFYYDGDCGLCVGFVRWAQGLDRRNGITWTANKSLDEPPAGLSWEAMASSAYLLSETGGLYEGFFAIREVLTRIRMLAPLGWLMSVQGAALIGRPMYRFVARNRHRFSSCRAQV